MFLYGQYYFFYLFTQLIFFFQLFTKNQHYQLLPVLASNIDLTRLKTLREILRDH